MTLFSWMTAVTRRTGLFVRRYEWPIVGLLFVTATGLGVSGFRSADPSSSLPDSLYQAMQLTVLQSGHLEGTVTWQLQIARFLMPALAGYVGLKAAAAIFADQIRLLSARIFPPSAVVCGLGERGAQIVRSLRDEGERVMVIEKDPANGFIEMARRSGALILVGDATDAEVLENAGVHRAGLVICATDQDSTNAEIAVRARELAIRKRSRGLTCNVHLLDQQLYALLKAYELSAGQSETFRLDCFNIFDAGARALLREHPPATGTGGAEEPHIMVVGLGRFGERLVIRAARELSGNDASGGPIPRITVLDRNAERKVADMHARYRQLADSCELTAYQIDFESPEFEQADFLFDAGGDCDVSHVYVCLGDSSLGMATALKLHQLLRGYGVPVVVRTPTSGGLASLLEADGGVQDEFETLYGFGLLEHLCDPDLLRGGTFEVIARAIHGDYVRQQIEQGQTPESNPSIRPWEELPETLKESNRAQAGHIGAKLRAAGYAISPLVDWDAGQFEFSPDEVERLAMMEHERWMEERLREGWTYAPGHKDLRKKTTPYLVPWEELDEATRELDRAPVRQLPSLLATVDLQIVRVGKMATPADTPLEFARRSTAKRGESTPFNRTRSS
jgi:hypothetical protein